MFRTFVHSLSLWWQDFSEDILGADLPLHVYEEDLLTYHRAHPHRRGELSSTGAGGVRRPGGVPPAEPVCLCPVPRAGKRPRAAAPR
ncbi:hypothetical protein [Conexibacter sp. DBS9H8]|uniref:hypothetical protein n=1 Tax=Conexibacter sp. DBS9H8 TaxID=2937801 RepID=UPI00200F1E37|nr:hypothetical protein [Conexibacter sp. DBS9H8]